jgi:hypothetical protein
MIGGDTRHVAMDRTASVLPDREAEVVDGVADPDLH